MNNNLSFEGFNVTELLVTSARRITELESQNGELVKDLNELIKASAPFVDKEGTIYKYLKLSQILNKIEMKRGVLFE